MPDFPVRFLRLCAVLLLTAGAAVAEPLVTAEQVHRLGRKESAAHVPVKLTGVITYVRGKGPGLVLQDATGGVMLEWPAIPQDEDADPSFRVGMLAEIEGHTVTSPPTPRVYVTAFRELGSAPLPQPREMKVAELTAADVDGLLVGCRGVIREVRAEGDLIPSRLVLELGPASGRLFVWISRWDEETRASLLPGTEIEVRGVFMRWKTVNWMPLVPFVVVNQPDWIRVISPPPDAADVPLRPLAEVPAAAADEDFSERFRVRGTVTYAGPDAVVLENGGEALWIRPRERDDLSPGDLAEATGYPGMRGPRAELEDAAVRKTGGGEVPPGAAFEPDDFEKRELMWMDGRRVRLRGTLTRGSSDPDAPAALRFGSRQIPVHFAAEVDAADLPEDESLVEIEGVLEAGLNPRQMQVGRGVGDHRLFVQGPGDLRVIVSGPWWTPARLTTAFFIITAVAGAAAIWALFLNRRVSEKSRALVQEIAARREQEIVSDERRRLAADLHDTLEQTLTGVSLQLETLGSDASPKPLVLARRLLDRSREELRNAVWDLTPEVIGEKGFAAALEAISAEQSERGVRVDVTFAGDPALVPDRIAAHLCRVAQEAISNAVRHGNAGRIGIAATVTAGRAALRITDDGRGFDPAVAAGISTGHFGINGMKERMTRLGGGFAITSAPGTGATVEVSCPILSEDPQER